MQATKSIKSVDLRAIRNVESKVKKAVAFVNRSAVQTGEFIWKACFDTEMRISVAPGETADARENLRNKYQNLGRLQ